MAATSASHPAAPKAKPVALSADTKNEDNQVTSAHVIGLGNIVFAQNTFSDACGAYREALIREPQNVVAIFSLMIGLIAQNQLQDALTQGDNFLKIKDLKIARTPRNKLTALCYFIELELAKTQSE